MIIKQKDLESAVNTALALVLNHDKFLIGVAGSEWSITHRLAVYLERQEALKDWQVDCEYNRQGEIGDIKSLASNKRRVRPDIIVHHRGQTELLHNLLVIEVKKKNSRLDFAKVSEYTAAPTGNRRFQYMFGIALDLSPPHRMTWFENGKPIV